MLSLTPHGSRYQNNYSQPPSWCPAHDWQLIRKKVYRPRESMQLGVLIIWAGFLLIYQPQSERGELKGPPYFKTCLFWLLWLWCGVFTVINDACGYCCAIEVIRMRVVTVMLLIWLLLCSRGPTHTEVPNLGDIFWQLHLNLTRIWIKSIR